MNRINLNRAEKIKIFMSDIRVVELYKTYKVRPLNVLEKIMLKQLKAEYLYKGRIINLEEIAHI